MRSRLQSGFSLIELTLVVLIIAIASVPILGQFTHVTASSLIDEEIQTASQLAQEHAEQILATRRNQGYGAIALGTTNVNLSGHYARYTREVTVAEPSALSTCLAGTTCKSVVVTVNRGPNKRAEIGFVLVEY